MPARSIVTGTPPLAEQLLDLAAAAQVRGQVVGVVAEPAEVDDPAQPGVRGGAARTTARPSASRSWKSAESSECTR